MSTAETSFKPFLEGRAVRLRDGYKSIFRDYRVLERPGNFSDIVKGVQLRHKNDGNGLL